MNPRPSVPVALLLTIVPAAASHAAVLINTADATYAQSFDSLANTGTPAWTNDSTLVGWHALNNSGGAPPAYIPSSGGSSSFDSLFSFGNDGATERALGSQTNTGATFRIGLSLLNNTTQTIASVTVTYSGEQWRRANNDASADGYAFDYQVFASAAGLGTVSGWTAEPTLNFLAPQPGPSGAGALPLDGNAAANRVAGITATISGLAWAPGEELWLRWTDTGVGPRRHQIAIDDISVQIVPEPATLAIALAGVASMTLCTRRTR